MSEKTPEQEKPVVSKVDETLVQEEKQTLEQEVVVVPKNNAQRLFVVVGRDGEMNKSAVDIITKLGFEPVLLGSSQEATAAIVGNPENYKDISFAIAVLSDDDVATPREEFPKNALLQPGAEEIFLLGFLTAQLKPQNIFSIFQAKQNFKKPFQHTILSYVPYDKENRWHFDLVRALKTAGYDVDANKLM